MVTSYNLLDVCDTFYISCRISHELLASIMCKSLEYHISLINTLWLFPSCLVIMVLAIFFMLIPEENGLLLILLLMLYIAAT